MDHVARGIDQNISVVSILDIEQVGENCVTGEAFDEIFLGLIVVFAKVFFEERVQGPFLWRELFLKVVDWICIWDELKKTRIRACHENFIRSEVNIQILRLIKYLVEAFHDLDGEDLLAHIVIGLYDELFQRPWFILHGKPRMLVILDHLFLVICKWVTHTIQIQVRVAYLFPSIGILLLTRIVFLFIGCLVSRFLRGNWVFLWSYDWVFQMFRRLIEQVVLLLSALLLVSQLVVPDSFNDHFEWGSLLCVKGLTQFGDYVYYNMGVFIISSVGFQGKHEAVIVVSVGTLNILFGERRPRRSCSRRNNRNLLNGLNLTSNMTLNPIIHFE